MKQHLITGAIAAAVSAVIAGGAWLGAPSPKVTHEVVHVAASSHTWPGISKAARAAIVGDLGDKLSGAKVIIVCQDGSCTDLAQDIDDALEDAKADSVLDRPAFPLGYGIGITVDPGLVGQANALAASIALRAGVQIPVTEGRPDGYIVLAIGKRPRA